MVAEAYVVCPTDEDSWNEGNDQAATITVARPILWFGCALVAVCVGALVYHAGPTVGTAATSDAGNQSIDSSANSTGINRLPELVKQAREFLKSPDVQVPHRIHSISERASVKQIDGTDYLLQPVILTDGIRRTAHFAISEGGLLFDRASFVGDTDRRWSTLAGRGSLLDKGGNPSTAAALGPCRLYVRPADYFNFGFASPEKFICFKLDDADRQLSAYGYAPRDSAVARDLERVFGTEAVSSPTGLATDRRWTAHALTLELSVPEESAPNQFLIQRILSDSWLLASAPLTFSTTTQ